MSILSIQEVSKFYGDYQALDSVSIEISKGSIFGLLGPNGAGKTSLIRIINQITGPDKGKVLFDGQNLSPEHISRIGYLPEERGLYPKMKVGEQIMYLARLKNLDKASAKKTIKDWFQRFEIESWWNKNVEELSKGMQQKVQFIATVIHQPDLLIFDEPFTGFDPINTNLIKSEIRRLRDEGATIIFSTHRMESVEEICDDIALINKSHKILEGPIKEVKKAHKSHNYIMEVKGDFKDTLPTGMTMKTNEFKDGISLLKVAIPDDNPTALIEKIISQHQLISFNEEIPSLNDIFIQKVQEV
tara:strand:- start:818 stop:1720 length:903 start_codon:yes stop_codon:yes gene_type:complete